MPEAALTTSSVAMAQHGSLAWVSQAGTDQADNAAAITGRDNLLYVGATTFGVFDGFLPLGDSDGYIQALRTY